MRILHPRAATIAFALSVAVCVASCGSDEPPLAFAGDCTGARCAEWARPTGGQRDGAADALAHAAINEQADKLIDDVSAVSGLPVRQRVPVSIVGSAEQAERLAGQMVEVNESDLFLQMNDGLTTVLEALGLRSLMPDDGGHGSDADDNDTMAAGLPPPPDPQSRVLGFYDPTKKAFFINEHTRPSDRVHTIRHELMHALQDQSFDLVGKLLDAIPDIDQVLAMRAVVEGQAEVAAYLAEQYRADGHRLPTGPMSGSWASAMKPGKAIGEPQWPLAPRGHLAAWQHRRPTWLAPILVSTGHLSWHRDAEPPDVVYFPYREGSHFIAWLVRQYGGAESFPRWVRETLTHPPRSTREIYHPVHYLTARAGVVAPAPSVKAMHFVSGYSPGWESALGELMLRGYLAAHTKRDGLANAFVSDRLVVLTPPNEGELPVVAWLTRWQSPAAASSFISAARVAQRRVASDLRAAKRTVPRAYVGHQGAVVGVLLNVPRSSANTMGQATAARTDEALVEALRQALAESQ